MTGVKPEVVAQLRERLAAVRSMVYPGAAVEPVQREALLLIFDVIQAVLDAQDEDQ